MHKLKSIKRKFIATLLFAFIASAALIIHGIYFDLDLSQLQRLSLEGFLLTFIIIFPTLLFLEWVFDLENHEEYKYLENRINELEKKVKK
jgi:hypothetical protein